MSKRVKYVSRSQKRRVVLALCLGAVLFGVSAVTAMGSPTRGSLGSAKASGPVFHKETRLARPDVFCGDVCGGGGGGSCDPVNTAGWWDPDQGDVVRGVGRDVATRAYITALTPSNFCNYYGMLLGSIAIQDASPNGSPTRMIQMGEVYVSPGFASHFDCPAGGSTNAHVFVETFSGPDPTDASYYHCYTFGSAIPFGAGITFQLTNVPGSGWNAKWTVDGVTHDAGTYSFSGSMTSGYSVARAEAAYGDPPGPPSGFAVNFGRSQDSGLWQFKTDSSGCCASAWTDVSAGASIGGPHPEGGAWSVGSPDGSNPFRISW